jgi:hypothetical protein
MTRFPVFLTTFLLSTSLLAGPTLAAVAAPAPAAPTQAQASDTPTVTSRDVTLSPAEELQYKQMLKSASAMLGHISIANIALLHDMIPEASANTKSALEQARALEAQTSSLNADLIKSGRITYTADGKTKDFWLPLVNDALVVRSVDADYAKASKPSVEEADAEVVHTRIFLNTHDVREGLEKADAAFRTKNYGEAEARLTEAANSTFTHETVKEMPLLSARDNLILARELAKDKNYKAADFALSHAQQYLKQYESSAPAAGGDKAKKLEQEISDLQASISKNEPSALGSVEEKITAWVHNLEHGSSWVQ